MKDQIAVDAGLPFDRAQHKTRFIFIALVVLVAAAGCQPAVEKQSARRSNGDQPATNSSSAVETRSPSGTVTESNDQPGDTSGDSPTQGSAEQPPADQSGSTVQEPADSTGQPKDSAIDAALKSLEEKEEINPWAKPEVEPAEPHDELKPLIEKHWIRLHPGYEVWLDMPNKQVVVGGRICFRDGPLEMLACPMHTKEHESIVATTSNAEIVHTGLLAVGAIPGRPMKWDNEKGYIPPEGPIVQVTVVWTSGNAEGDRKEIDARQLVRDVETGKALEHQWVFCGSGEWRDPENPAWREYWADSGDMICVTSFSTAMMDLQVHSTNMQEGLRYYANPDNIPELGKPVLMFLKPDLTTNPKKD